MRVRKIELVKVRRVDKSGGVQKMFSQSFSEFRLGILYETQFSVSFVSVNVLLIIFGRIAFS